MIYSVKGCVKGIKNGDILASYPQYYLLTPLHFVSFSFFLEKLLLQKWDRASQPRRKILLLMFMQCNGAMDGAMPLVMELHGGWSLPQHYNVAH